MRIGIRSFFVRSRTTDFVSTLTIYVTHRHIALRECECEEIAFEDFERNRDAERRKIAIFEGETHILVERRQKQNQLAH